MSHGRAESPRRRRNHPGGPRGRVFPLRLLLLLVLILIFLLLLALAVFIAWRSLGDEVSGTSVAKDSVDSGPEPRIRLLNERGSVRVEGVESSTVGYEVTKHALGSDAENARQSASRVDVDVSREGSSLVIETRGGRQTGADYVLRIPRDGSVEIESGTGDVGVTGLTGDVSVRAGVGDVTIREAGGTVEIEAQQGDVEVASLSTDTGQVEVNLEAGDVELEDLVLGTLDVRVASGDAILSGRFSGGGRVVVDTGDILVQLPPEDARELTLEARIGDVVPGEEN